MCGFAGVIAWDERYRTSRETLARMSAAIAHRGPDGEGTFFNHEGEISAARPQCALAFRRLAILDPDARSNQPFTIGGKTLVFNGEIYNFRELRQQLSSLRPDYAWRTSGDTEVLLMAFELWGEKCVDHLNGMFAFAVWDEAEKSLFLARDRMGQKPLFYTAVAGAFAFASEPTAIAQGVDWFDARIDPQTIAEYLRFGATAGTAFSNLLCLPPGSTLQVVNSQSKLDRYFSMATGPATAALSDWEAVEQTRICVRRAVERQLVSDVPLGVFLSGGVDSSVIAAAARKLGEVRTFSIGFDDPRYDETVYADRVAKHLGTEHHVFRVTPSAALDLPKLAAMFGTPFGDSSALPTHYLARETRAIVKVALSGDGGDELFCGYDRYRAMRWARRLARFSAVGVLGKKWSGGHPKSLRARAGRFAISLGLPAGERYESYLRIFDEPTIRELMGDALSSNRAERFEQCAQDRDDVRAAMLLDQETYLPHDLLTKVDRCSMLHGLEVRSPFMDHELVQFSARLTTDQLLKGGPKRMLREAFADELPAFVFKRKKMGFAVPIGEWFRGELRQMLRDCLFAGDGFCATYLRMPTVRRLVEEHEARRVDHSQRLYVLLMAQLWARLIRSP
jgi:asparagine synthase (glutamine-hydrolysing)